MNENIKKKMSDALDLAYSLGKMSESKGIAVSPKRYFDMILDSIELAMMREEQCPPAPIKTAEVITFAHTGVGCEDDCADCLCSTCEFDCAENHIDGFKCRSGEYVSDCGNYINNEDNEKLSWRPFNSKRDDGLDGCEACLCDKCTHGCAENCGHICEDLNRIVGTCLNFEEG